MEQIEKMKKEYTDQFNKSNEYRLKLLEEVKKTETSMEQLRGAFQALEQLATQIAAAPAATPDVSATPATPTLSVVPDAAPEVKKTRASKKSKSAGAAETSAKSEEAVN